MESDISDFTLPPAPRGLCFDRNDFVKTHFSVDNFLADHENGPSLETLRDDLGVYLKVLRLAMIELINKDYAHFVNLSATLIGFDKTIEKIQEPLSQLHDEVMNVKQSLEDAMKELSMWLNQRNTLHKKKQTLKYYSQTLNSLKTLQNILNNITNKKITDKVILIDRAAMEYNQLMFSITKCESLINNEHKTQFKTIGENITEVLNEILFNFLTEKDEINLLKTLLTLASLNKVSETEMLIRRQAIAPLLQEIINETNLQKNKDGLEGIYTKILSLLDNKLKLLRTIMQHSKLENLHRKFNFIVNCFWCEVESRLEVNLASIFAPGNPKIFYKRYNESMQFVKKLEEYCDDENIVVALHETAEYKSFQRRWNLPVYFQIRFQEIAGSFESSLHQAIVSSSNSDFKLTQTVACWNSIQECWADGVYIEALAHKFWKLTLQILTRYCNWCCDVCRQKPSKPEPSTPNKELLSNSINIYIDTQTLIQRLQQYPAIIQTKLRITNTEIIERSLRPTIEGLKSVKTNVIQTLSKELYEYFNTQIKQVSDIPRLYRKTNRSVPNKPCPYIDVIKKYLINFNEETSNKVDNEFLVELYKNLFDVLTVSYSKYVEDVLTSVQKTEDSLRRLKQIREMSSNTGSETGVSDGDKIRLQLHMDVAEYGHIITTLKLQVKDVEKYNELTFMIKETVKNIIDIK